MQNCSFPDRVRKLCRTVHSDIGCSRFAELFILRQGVCASSAELFIPRWCMYKLCRTVHSYIGCMCRTVHFQIECASCAELFIRRQGVHIVQNCSFPDRVCTLCITVHSQTWCAHYAELHSQTGCAHCTELFIPRLGVCISCAEQLFIPRQGVC